MLKIVQLTSAHPRYDTRIFHKICRSLSKKYDVILIVADGNGDEVIKNINIIDIGKPLNRKDRILNTTKKIFKKAIELNASVYHLHDPELIPIGIKLKNIGKKVIFDSHEDLPKQILSKHYLNKFTKNILSFLYSKYEIFALKKFDYVIASTFFIRDKFLKYKINSIDINNFPILDDFTNIKPNFKKKYICYIGTLYQTRGIKEIIQAIENLNVNLIIAGKFYDKKFEKEVRSLKGWEKVDFRGFVNKEEIKKILQNSFIGIVTLYPTPSYVESFPVKMFEYMAAGIPVIASNFPLWREIIEKNNCGICVDPTNPKEIAKAINFLLTNDKIARQMGENGLKVVKEKYNWKKEEEKLFKIYEDLIK